MQQDAPLRVIEEPRSDSRPSPSRVRPRSPTRAARQRRVVARASAKRARSRMDGRRHRLSRAAAGAPVTQEQALHVARRMASERSGTPSCTSRRFKITVAEVIALYKAELERVEHESPRPSRALSVARRADRPLARGAAHHADARPPRGPVAEEADDDLAAKDRRLASSTIGSGAGGCARRSATP